MTRQRRASRDPEPQLIGCERAARVVSVVHGRRGHRAVGRGAMPDLVDGAGLGLGEARRREIGASVRLAEQRWIDGRIVVARRGIAHVAVGLPGQRRVARRDRGGGRRAELGVRDGRPQILLHDDLRPDGGHCFVEVDDGRPRQHAVEILGVTLHLLEPLTATGRAAVPVAELGLLAVERPGQRLGLEGHLVRRAIGEIAEQRLVEAAVGVHDICSLALVDAVSGVGD